MMENVSVVNTERPMRLEANGFSPVMHHSQDLAEDFFVQVSDCVGVPQMDIVAGKEHWSALIQALGIQPHRWADLYQVPDWLALQHATIMQQRRRFALPLSYIGIAPIPEDTQLFRGVDSDWALMNLADDPSFEQCLYTPKSVKRDIERILSAGVNFDMVCIAHELPLGHVKPGEPVPLDLIMPAPPLTTMRRLELLNTISQMWWAVVKTATAVATAIGVGAPVAVASTALAMPLAVLMDPILFGVNIIPQIHSNSRPVGMWYYLTHWYWSAGNN